MSNAEIATRFRQMADLLELRGENQFKIRSYRAAADTLEDLATPLAQLAGEGGPAEAKARLKELPGVGAAISQKIIDLLSVGTFKAWDELTAEIPATTLDLLQVEGIGMKTLQLLYSQFQLTSLADFAKFVAGGGLASVPRMNERAQARIHSSLKQLGY